MAVTLLGDLNAYDQYIRSGYMEGLTYFINIFNSGSLGTILLESENTTGTLKHTSYWNDFLTMARRDVTVNTAQASEKMTKNEHTAFKTFWKSIPQEFTWTAFKTAENETKETVMFRLGRKLAEKKMAYFVTRAINIVSAAIGSQSDLVIDRGTSNFNMLDIIDGMSKFGDAANRLKCLVLHSAVGFPLIKDQAMNYKYDSGSGLVIYGGSPATFGKPLIITDNPGLTYVSGEDTLYKTLFLTDNAITLSDNGATSAILQDVSGLENITSRFQAEGDMWNYVKGYQLKSAASPSENPDDDTLTDSLNWERWVNSNKLTAGVLFKSGASLASVTQVTNVKIVS